MKDPVDTFDLLLSLGAVIGDEEGEEQEPC